MKIAAAYIRVSTDDQVELSPDSQLKQIKEYAKKNGYSVPDEYVFKDEGISGRNTAKRPEFNRMIGTAKTKPKPFDAILLWKFSRFARNREDSIVYKSMLRKQCGISVISISENLGDDKMSVLIEALIEAMDEYYSINLAEEVRRGMMEKISRGELITSAPLGYDVIKGMLIINEQEAEIVRYIYKEYLSGVPMIAIARNLNEAGTTTKKGKQFENRIVKYILQNPTYIGKHRWCADGKNGSSTHYSKDADVIVYDGRHEPIINLSDYEKAQAKLALNKRYSREIVKHENMLRGLIKCHSCGKTLTMSMQDGEKRYLQCCGYTHGFCKKSHLVRYDYVCNSIIDALQKADYATISRKISPSSTTSKSAELKKRIAREETKLVRCKEAYQNGIDTLDEYKDNKSHILSIIKEMQTELETAIHPSEKELKKIKNKITVGVKQILGDQIGDDEKNAILKQLIEKIIYNSDTKELDVWFKA